MKAEPRTASQVLLEIEQQLMTLTKAVALIDHNQKLILNRLGDMKAPVSLSAVSAAQTPVIVSQRPLLDVSTVPRAPVRQQPAIVAKQPTIEKSKDEAKAGPDTGSKIPVLQKILDQHGKVAYMTAISIREKDSSTQVFDGKTNTAGKWSAYLPPGTYIAKLSKTNQETKEMMEFFEEFQISPSMKTLGLPDFTLKK